MKTLFTTFFLFIAIVSFSQFRYLIPYREGKLWGYADTNLNIVVPARYTEATQFQLGYAIVTKEKFFGLINTEGVEILHPVYLRLGSYYNGFISATKNDSAGLISLPDCKPVLPFIHKNIDAFSDFDYVVEGNNSLKGLFDVKTRKWLLPLIYEEIGVEYRLDSSYNYEIGYFARNKKDTVYFTYSTKGVFNKIKPKFYSKPQPVVMSDRPPESVRAELFQNGFLVEPFQNTFMTDTLLKFYDTVSLKLFNRTNKLYIVKKDNKMGMVTSQNKIVIPLIYDNFKWLGHILNHDFFIVTKQGKQGVVNEKGETTIPVMYDEVKQCDSSASYNIYIVKNNKKYGLAQGNKLLLPCEYDEINSYRKDGFDLHQNNKTGAYIFFRKKSLYNIFIPAKYDYLLDINPMFPTDYNPALPSNLANSKPKYFIYVSRENKRGYADLNGKEFFKD